MRLVYIKVVVPASIFPAAGRFVTVRDCDFIGDLQHCPSRLAIAPVARQRDE
jgi:hypothetical protein